MVDCPTLLNRLLLVSERRELDSLIDDSRDCFTRTFVAAAAQEIVRWIEEGESTAWHVWPVLDYALQRLNNPVLCGDLAAAVLLKQDGHHPLPVLAVEPDHLPVGVRSAFEVRPVSRLTELDCVPEVPERGVLKFDVPDVPRELEIE